MAIESMVHMGTSRRARTVPCVPSYRSSLTNVPYQIWHDMTLHLACGRHVMLHLVPVRCGHGHNGAMVQVARCSTCVMLNLVHVMLNTVHFMLNVEHVTNPLCRAMRAHAHHCAPLVPFHAHPLHCISLLSKLEPYPWLHQSSRRVLAFQSPGPSCFRRPRSLNQSMPSWLWLEQKLGPHRSSSESCSGLAAQGCVRGS